MADNNELHERYFPPQKVTYPQIYAYRMKLEPDELKVGFTTQENVRDRIADQLGTANIDYTLEFVGAAIKNTGESFNDHPVHKWLEDHGAIRVPRKAVFATKGGRPPEIFRNCTVDMVRAAVMSIVTGTEVSASRINSYKPRAEQKEAIEKTKSITIA